MHKPSLVAGATGLVIVALVAIVWWRQSDLQDELASLRAQLMASSREQSGPAIAEAPPAPESVAAPLRADTPGDERIAELERVANAQADVIENLLARLEGMEMKTRKAAAPAWSALQAIGGPDSSAGDQRTAWAPSTEDGGTEWLQVDFPSAVEAAMIIVRENSAPGAVVRISAVTEAGNEVPLWQGDAPKVAAVSDTPFPATPGVLTNRVKIYLETKKVAGWNEIDAVQLVGRDGSRQWASGASASSSYGSGGNSGLQLGSEPSVQWDYQIDHSFKPSGGLEFEGLMRMEKPDQLALKVK